ncbi:hypothetical protein J2Z60_002128 [Lactobacillus colini]|uniref:S-layer protein C-terminal domain-containing protein n=1 Tax=Lactobacillus colini TaxID=1819254 RepID=A0ABS4MHW6_9LACO|nr:SLAP domain-containing protein [Lactobacillus colini]MBP2058937.1 hypothetical protein [Lactobacillus colini]
MNLHKKLLTITSTLAFILPITVSNKIYAADSVVTKTLMHNSAVYNKSGEATGEAYAAYQNIEFYSKPVKIKGQQYYRISYENNYIKLSNIDGVKRKVTANSYVYASSVKRANKRLIRKGSTITTYGGSYKFKNGKRYYRIGGPKKQYVKVANLSKSADEVAVPAKEEVATATVTSKLASIYTGTGKNGQELKVVKKKLKVGSKFTVDRFSNTPFSNWFPSTQYGDAPMYRIKGTNNWLHYADVKVNKELELHSFDLEHSSRIKFIKDTDIYNADGTMQDHQGQKIAKQGGSLKVDKLVYLWVPSEQKAELFYHPVAQRMYATSKGSSDIIELHNGYVKASDVKFNMGLKLIPGNTPQEAKVAYDKLIISKKANQQSVITEDK